MDQCRALPRSPLQSAGAVSVAAAAEAAHPSLRRRACCAASCLALACTSALLVLDSDAALRSRGSLRAMRQYVDGISDHEASSYVNSQMARLWSLATQRPPTVWSISTFPNPRLDPEACGLSSASGLICDPDRLLPNSSRFAIQDRLQRLNDDLEYVLGVAVMERLDVSSLIWPNWPHVDAMVDNFAHGLLREWKLGQGNFGVMMVVVRDPDYVSIFAEGKAANRGLDQVLCRSIADYGVLPYVDDGYLDRGVVSGVEEIAVALRHPPEPMRPWPLSDKLFMLCCLVTCLASCICIAGCCCRGEDDSTLPRQPPHRSAQVESRQSAVRPGHPQPHVALASEDSSQHGGFGGRRALGHELSDTSSELRD